MKRLGPVPIWIVTAPVVPVGMGLVPVLKSAPATGFHTPFSKSVQESIQSGARVPFSGKISVALVDGGVD